MPGPSAGLVRGEEDAMDKVFTGYEIGPYHKLTPHYIDRPPMGTIDTVLDQFKANMATAAEKMASAEIAMLAVEGFVTLSANRTRRLTRYFEAHHV